MPSTYTVNLGIEKPATGEQSGTWGDTTNVNFDIIDQAVNGSERVTLTSAGTSGSPNDLNIVNGSTTSSEGRNKWIEIYSASDLGGSAYVRLVPNDAEKILFIRNSLAGSQSVLLFQGTYNASNDLEIPAGVDMVVKFDGAGASATVTDVFTKLRATEITTPTLTAGTADINGGSVDGATIGAASASTGAFTTLTASTNLNIASSTTVDGVLDEDNMASDSATKLATQQSIKAYVDSQVGTVDTWAEVLANGATSGATNPEIDSGQSLKTNTINETTAGSGVTIDSVLLKDDSVNAATLEVTTLKANDGTAAGSIADSTGVVTLNSVDINGGNIDGTTIGATSTANGSFSTLTGATINATSVIDTPDIETARISARDGTTAIDITDSTGAVDISSGSLEISGATGQLTLPGATPTVEIGAATSTDTNLNLRKSSSGTVGINFQRGTNPDTDFRIFMDSSENVNFDWDYSSTIAADRSITFTAEAGANNLLKIDTTGDITFYDGANASFVYDASAGLTINEAGADRDFRVESDTDTHALFVDAGNSRVGINENSPNAMLHVKTSGTDEMLRLEMVDDSNTAGPDIVMQRVSASPAANDPVGRIRAIGENSDGSGVTYGRMEFFIDDPTAGSEDGLISISTELGGANIQRLAFKPDEVVFNEPSADSDFRVESDASTHMLFVDAGANAVKIGQSTGAHALNVNGNISVTEDDFIGFDSEAHYIPRSDNLGVTGNSAALVSLNDIVIGTRTNQAGSGNIYIGRDATTVGGTGWFTNFLLGEEGNAVFNEDGRSGGDFRVESDSNTHMLFVDAGNNQVIIGDGTAVGSALFLQRFSSATGYTTTNDTRYATGKQVIFNESNTTTSFAGITLLTGATSGGTVELNAIRHGTALRSDFAIKTRNADGNSSEKLRLTGHDGHLGIGVDDPLAPLSINKTPDTSYGVANFAVPSGNPTWVTLNRDGSQDGGFKIQRSTTADMRLFVNSDEATVLNYNGGNTGDSFQIIQGAGSGALVATFDSGNNIIFNDNSGDQDFRVESDTNANMLFVDASENTVTVGASAKDAALGTASIFQLVGNNSTGVGPEMLIHNPGQGSDARSMLSFGNKASGVEGYTAHLYTTNNDGIYIATSTASGGFSEGTARLNISDGGTVTWLMAAGTEFRVNEEGNDADFRVESDANTHALYVDAGNNVTGTNVPFQLGAIGNGTNAQIFNSKTPTANTATDIFSVDMPSGAFACYIDVMQNASSGYAGRTAQYLWYARRATAGNSRSVVELSNNSLGSVNAGVVPVPTFTATAVTTGTNTEKFQFESTRSDPIFFVLRVVGSYATSITPV